MHEQVHERARQEDEERQKIQDVLPMFRKQEQGESNDSGDHRPEQLIVILISSPPA